MNENPASKAKELSSLKLEQDNESYMPELFKQPKEKDGDCQAR